MRMSCIPADLFVHFIGQRDKHISIRSETAEPCRCTGAGTAHDFNAQGNVSGVCIVAERAEKIDSLGVFFLCVIVRTHEGTRMNGGTVHMQKRGAVNGAHFRQGKPLPVFRTSLMRIIIGRMQIADMNAG